MNTDWKEEEFWNALSHGLGVVLGFLGIGLLLYYDTSKSSYSTLSILFYGCSIVMLYSASTLYHLISHISWKHILRKIDHISIYFLIAGTYTPVALIALESSTGWLIFWTVWGIALVGTVLKIFFTGRFEVLSLLLYLLMGWLIVFDWNNLVAVSSDTGINLLMLGGAFYTVGIVFYAIRKIPFNHLIWHFFVLAGSISHFLYILIDVI